MRIMLTCWNHTGNCWEKNPLLVKVKTGKDDAKELFKIFKLMNIDTGKDIERHQHYYYMAKKDF